MPPKRRTTIATEAKVVRGNLEKFCQLLEQEGVAQQFRESIQEARHLITTLDREFEIDRAGPRLQLKVQTATQHQKQKWYLKRKVNRLQSQMNESLQAKFHGRIQSLWFIMVAFADPAMPLQGLSTWCAEFGVEEQGGISSTYITRIRDAMCQVLKKMNRQELAMQAASLPCIAETDISEPIFATHVHDEAAMRLRSYDNTLPDRILRGRLSKIQNNSVTLTFGNESYFWLTELQPLQKKDGPTIAEALVSVTEEIFASLIAFPSRPWKQLRYVHLLTGDGINTNQNAAKRLLQRFHNQDGVKYSLIVWKCASHVINLCVVAAICGTVLADPVEHDDVCAACSRFFRYLVHDYIEEYNAALRTYIFNQLRIVRPPPDAAFEPEGREMALKLQRLYSAAVLPDELLHFFNGSLRRMEHICRSAQSDDVLKNAAFRILSKYFFFIEERPVPTRFWLFSNCVHCLLRMRLCGLPSDILGLREICPNKENQKRLSRFLSFYSSVAADQRLRQASLCLQLTDLALNLVAQTRAQDGKPPCLVRLAQGNVETRTCQKFSEICALLQDDPDLDQSSALFGLLVTESHIIIRMAEFQQYPAALWKLTQEWNPAGYVYEIECFLEQADENLDTGYSLQLKQDAWKNGNLPDAIAYILSDRIQSELGGIFRASAATSLEVERKHWQDRRTEGKKFIGVARASRNSILSRYRVLRRTIAPVRKQQVKLAKSLRHMSAPALAAKRNPSWLPRPAGFNTVAHVGNKPALDEYYAQNKNTLEAEAKRIRETAKAFANSSKDMELSHGMPFSNSMWMKWIEANDAEFRKQLRSATRERKVIGARLQPRPAGLPSASRIGPRARSTTSTLIKKFLQQKQGWFSVTATASPLVLFVVTLIRQVWAVPLQQVRGRHFEFDLSLPFCKLLKPISEILRNHCGSVSDEDQATLDQLEIELVNFDGKMMKINIVAAETIVLRPRKPKKTSGAPGSSSESDEDDKIYHLQEESGSEELESDIESALEQELEEPNQVPDVGGEEGDEQDLADRAPSGTHVFDKSGYFTFVNYATKGEKKDCKVIVCRRFCVPGPFGLGLSNKSKTLQILSFDESLAHPVRSHILLKAWSLFRSSQGDWLDYCPSRRRWWNDELNNLKKEIAALGYAPGTIGSHAADEKLREWCPQALTSD